MAKYTIKKGDNLAALAKKWGVSTAQILDANPGVYGMGPGVTLRIPVTQGDPFDISGKKKTPPLPTPISIPPRFTPPVGTPYIPPPPAPGTKPKSPTLPPAYQPPAPAYQPPAPQQPTYIDPGLRRAAESFVGPQPQRQHVPQPAPPGIARPGVRGPGVFDQRITPQPLRTSPIGQRVQDFINRLFRPTVAPLAVRGAYGTPIGAPPGIARPGVRGPGARRLGTQELGLEPSRAGGVPSPTTFAQLVEGGMSPRQATLALQSGEFAPPTVGTMGAEGFPEFEEEGYPGYPAQRSSILEWYLDQGRLPVIFFREDLARLGITEQELLAAGYVRDQYGDWVRGTQEPGEVERAAATGGGGGGYGYPRYAPGGYAPGGYGYPGYGGGGGIEINFPEGGRSFVQQQQRGVSPTGRSMRPARMGAVTWRI